jgi:carbon storage regulator
MLVLSRKLGEQILIGENAVVSILSVSGSRVRVGVTAAPRVRILRGELAAPVPDGRGVAARIEATIGTVEAAI